jgi:hypothetical protein
VCASAGVVVEAVTTGVLVTGVSVLEAEVALVALGVLGALASFTGAATGTGVGTTAEAVGAGEEEVFFAILCWYTLIGEVFLSIFRHYILYFILNMQ